MSEHSYLLLASSFESPELFTVGDIHQRKKPAQSKPPGFSSQTEAQTSDSIRHHPVPSPPTTQARTNVSPQRTVT